jgi:hypothetical protein
MKTFTLEWNAVTTLEDKGRPGRAELLELVAMHGSKIDVGIVTTAASENTRLRKMPATAAEFRDRLETLGLQNLTMVLTVGVWDLTYWDLCRWGSGDASRLVERLWPLIKPTTAIPRSHLDFAQQEGVAPDIELQSPEFAKWRNKWCDVYSLEAHIAAGRDVFVSGDVKNFRGSRRAEIIALVAGNVCSYAEALEIAKST